MYYNANLINPKQAGRGGGRLPPPSNVFVLALSFLTLSP